MCKEKYCKIRPTFNIKGENPLYCSKHKKDGMINVVSKKCIYEGCKNKEHLD